MSRMAALTRTDQKFLSFGLLSLWNCIPVFAGLSCRSKAVVLTAFCSSPFRRARLSVKVSAMRKSVTFPFPSSEPPGHARYRSHHVVAQGNEIRGSVTRFFLAAACLGLG